MKLTAPRKDLADAITRAAQGLSNRPYQPVYANMHLHARCSAPGGADDIVFLTCSDGFMTFQATAPCNADEDWSCIIPGRVLAEIAKYFPVRAENVEITCDLGTGLVTVAAGRSVFTLTAAAGDEFPAMYQSAWGDTATLKAADFREAVLKVAPAVAVRHTNPALTGILFQADGEILSLVATDSYCMAHVPVEMNLNNRPLPATPVVVPVAAAERFARLADGDITLGWDDRVVTLEMSGLVMISRQIEGTFPPGWAGILAHEGGWTTVDTAELLRAVRVASLIAPQPPGDRVVLEFDGNDLNVTARGLGECAEYVTTDYSGDTARFIFGAKMLLTGLAGSEEQIRLAFVPGGNRVLLESGALRFIMVPRKDTEGGE